MAHLTRRNLLQGAAAAAGVALTPGALSGATRALAQAPKPASRPNIVLLYVDDLDFDEIGFFDGKPHPPGAGKEGKQLTPHMDSLAKNGAVFSNFYITSPVCTPSRYSLLTGRFAERSPGLLEQAPPGTLANIGFNTPIMAGESNIAKELKKLGYTTGVTGKWHNFPRSVGLSDTVRNFPADADPRAPQVAAWFRARYEKAVAHLREGYGWDEVKNINIGNTEMVNPTALAGQNMEWHTQAALEFIDSNQAKPFFLYFGIPVPHGHYRPLARLNPLATAAGLIDEAPQVQPTREEVARRVREAGLAPGKEMGAWLDDSIGAILKKLDALGLRENTLIVFVSDHQSRAKNNVYEGAHVPALMNWPAQIRPGTQVGALSCNNDIAATLIEAAGGKAPPEMAQDGRSLLQWLRGQKPAAWREALLLEIGYSRAAVTPDWKYVINRAPETLLAQIRAEAGTPVRLEKDKSLGWNGLRRQHFGAELEFPAYFETDQLYHLKIDPLEKTNLVANPVHAAKLGEMKAKLQRLMEPLPHPAGEFGTPPAAKS